MRLYPVDDNQTIKVKLQIDRDRRIREIPLRLLLEHYEELLVKHENYNRINDLPYSQNIQNWAKEAIKSKGQIALKKLKR